MVSTVPMHTDSDVILILLTAIAGQVRQTNLLKSIDCRSIDVQHQCECALVNANIDNLSLLHVKIHQKSKRPERLRITLMLIPPEGPAAVKAADLLSKSSILDELFHRSANLLQ